MESITEKQKEELFEKIIDMDRKNIQIDRATNIVTLFLHVNNKWAGTIHIFSDKTSSICIQSNNIKNFHIDIGSFTNAQTQGLMNLFEIDFKEKTSILINQLIKNLK